MAIFAGAALLPEGWVRNVRITLDGGRIAQVRAGAAAGTGDVSVDALVPGMANLHSHAFQRAMAGLTERRGATADSFWTWREMMYRFALGLDPDQMQAVAEMAYVEMLEAGFTRVGEFHYLHHDRDGAPYADAAEMSLRILAAAEAAGLHLTHLPVFYAHSDFGGAAPGAGQRRFLHDLDGFCRLTERMAGALRPGDRLGIAPHSLRAVTEAELAELLRAHPTGPVHIHVAEQLREVEESLAHCGRRPVETLLQRFAPDGRWCLIHATHLTEAERQGMARAGVVAGLCPVTEANLGDGLFPAAEFLDEGGRIGVGSDSNVEISLREELKLLEYGQRLVRRQRNVLAQAEGSTGARLFGAALAGGAQALGAPEPVLAPGAVADLVGLRDAMGLSGPEMLDRWLFGRDIAVGEVWAAGRHLVQAGRHVARDGIAARYGAVLRRLIEA
ncbi:MAG: formimidoylglutamate deiminase [Paracoccaceae bacterium]